MHMHGMPRFVVTQNGGHGFQVEAYSPRVGAEHRKECRALFMVGQIEALVREPSGECKLVIVVQTPI